jgi:hypothetical protein
MSWREWRRSTSTKDSPRKEQFMDLLSLRIATTDVSRLAEFYTKVTGIKPFGSGDFVEFRTSGAALALCSQRSVDTHNAGATTPASIVLPFWSSASPMSTMSGRG